MTISEKIRMVTKRNNMTITALASGMGISRQYLARKLNNNEFTLKELEKIAEVTGCSVEYTFVTSNGERL